LIKGIANEPITNEKRDQLAGRHRMSPSDGTVASLGGVGWKMRACDGKAEGGTRYNDESK
ncbi:unnamed protein product, partial [Allacma fusca]